MYQHDKLKKFRLWLHVYTDVFSGRILWIKIWWTNSNPYLICSWYLQTVREIQGLFPLGLSSNHTYMLRKNYRSTFSISKQSGQRKLWCCECGNTHVPFSWSEPQQHLSALFQKKKKHKNRDWMDQYHLKFSLGFKNLFDWGVNKGSMMEIINLSSMEAAFSH